MTGSQPDIEILQPVNLVLSVQRNLAATWYHQIPAIGIKGDLKPMEVTLYQFYKIYMYFSSCGYMCGLVTRLSD